MRVGSVTVKWEKRIKVTQVILILVTTTMLVTLEVNLQVIMSSSQNLTCLPTLETMNLTNTLAKVSETRIS